MPRPLASIPSPRSAHAPGPAASRRAAPPLIASRVAAPGEDAAVLLASLALLLLVGCGDVAPTAGGAPSLASPAVAVAGRTAEHDSLRILTRAVAAALDDQGIRARLLADLRAAPFHEHKLELRSYVRGASGGILLAKMAKETGRSRESLGALVESVRPLEMYMPVAEHRARWRGGADVLVAGALEDEDLPVAFAAGGRSVDVAADRAPATPAIALVPVETDFSSPVDLSLARNVDDEGGASIGSLLVIDPCIVDPGACEPAPSPAPTKPPGLYMTFSRYYDVGEPWTKGNPEIEVHIHGPSETSAITDGIDLSCSGQYAKDPYKRFDQNDKFWSGDVLLFSKAEIDAFRARANDGFNVLVWEDDDTACTIKNDKDNIEGAIEATSEIYKVASVKSDDGILVQIGRFVAALYRNASWLLSNDDWLGDAVDQRMVGRSDADATHAVMKGTSYNGRIRLVMRR
jgi:hypothetical protein